MRRTFLTQMAAMAATLAAPKAFAQAAKFPDHPIRVMVGFAPGGSVDPIIRLMQPKLGELLGQPWVIENRPGGSTSIACSAVKQAPADGYTLLFTAGSGHAVHTIDQPQYSYDPLKDFVPIASASRAGWAFAVTNSLPVKTLAEYVAYCKANPNKISFGSSGVGLINHLAMERFNMAAGIKCVHVPYKSSGSTITDLVSGRIQAYFTAASSLQPLINAGQLRAIAYTAVGTGEVAPAQMFASIGLPDLDQIDSLNVLLGPAGMPASAQAILTAACEKVLAMPDVQAGIKAQQQVAFFENSAKTMERLKGYKEQYTQVIRAANIKMGS
ncbi:MAG: tripartite tricarboxylate transporter substrate binding protein [Pseudomonadota bacterium]